MRKLKLFTIFFLVATLLFLFIYDVNGQDCNDVLQWGIMDTNETTFVSQQYLRFREHVMKSQSYDQASKSFDQFEAITAFFSFGGISAKENWNTWKSYFLKNTSLDVSSSMTFRNELTSANKDIISAWIKCINSHGLKVGLLRTLNPRIFNIQMKFVPTGIPGDRQQVVLKRIVFSEEIETQENKPLKNIKIGAEGRIFQIERQNDRAINVTMNFKGAPNSTRSFDLPEIVIPDPPIVPPIHVKKFEITTEGAVRYPEGCLDVPDGYKILSGGVKTNWVGRNPNGGLDGILIFESYPVSNKRWKARCREHLTTCISTITISVIALYDPENKWDVQIFTNSSSSSNSPAVTVNVPNTHVMTGGGARSITDCIPLYKCYPLSGNSWFAKGKDHGIPYSGVINAYAIGIKPNNFIGLPSQKIQNTYTTHGVYASPILDASVPKDYILVGGGGEAIFQNGYPGTLLTWNYNDIKKNAWTVRSKDHTYSCAGELRCYAIGIKWSSDVAN